MPLSVREEHLVKLYMAGCLHYWDQLPALAQGCYAVGVTPAELQACLRHLIVLAGYGPCLAAQFRLQKAKLLPPEPAAGKVGGAPGGAFEQVYGEVTDAVRRRMHDADPVLGEWIRLHLYGDVYSSPGLDLRAKQLLMCARLAQADMPEQLFGHALAAMRFGATRDAVEAAARLAFSMAPSTRSSVADEALKMITLAHAKFEKDAAGGVPAGCPEVAVPDPATIFVPGLPPPYTPPASSSGPPPADAPVERPDAKLGGRGGGAEPEAEAGDDPGTPVFAWEEADPRFDQATRTWRDTPL